MGYEEVYDKAVDLLARRAHFESELVQKLLKRGYDSDMVEKVIEECREKGYVNDLENARMYIQSLKNDKSAYYIKGKLHSKGVPKDIIGIVMEECEINEFDIAMKLVYKKLNLEEGEKVSLEYKEMLKICRYLSSKGFSYRVISDIKEYIM